MCRGGEGVLAFVLSPCCGPFICFRRECAFFFVDFVMTVEHAPLLAGKRVMWICYRFVVVRFFLFCVISLVFQPQLQFRAIVSSESYVKRVNEFQVSY